MAKSFSPSINIVRDAEQQLSYLPTQNAQKVFGQLVNNYSSGIHCFNIVGAYGTGKSAFLWAFQQTLKKKHEYFHTTIGFKKVKKFQFERFVGQFASLKETFARHFITDGTAETTTDFILLAIDLQYRELAKKNTALVIIIDEFGK